MPVVRAISDLHLTERTAPWVFAALKELEADAREHKGYTVIAGDILNEPTHVHMPTYNRLRSILQHWPGEVYVIPGNHDQYAGYGQWANALTALQGGQCRVIETSNALNIR